MNELPPLTRLLMVAEWLDSAATYQDRPGAMDEHEANATVLRQVHAALLAASDSGGRGEVREEWGYAWAAGNLGARYRRVADEDEARTEVALLTVKAHVVRRTVTTTTGPWVPATPDESEAEDE